MRYTDQGLRESVLHNEVTTSGGLQSEWQTIRDGLIQGAMGRAREAVANPFLTGLEVASAAGLGAGLALASRAGGRWGMAAEAVGVLFAMTFVADTLRRGNAIRSVYSQTTNSDLRRNVVAQYAGTLLFDYPLVGASAAAGAGLALQFRPGTKLESSQVSDRISEIGKDRKPTLQVDFKINQEQLALHTMKRGAQWADPGKSKSVIEFQNRAWELDRAAYRHIEKTYMENALIGKETVRDNSALGQRAWKLVETMQKDPTFKPVLSETIKARDAMKLEWEGNLAKSTATMRELTGLSLDKKISVHVTHPSQATGYSYGNGNVVLTYRTDFANYNTVYVWHEALHNIIPNKYVGPAEFDVGHSVIQLLADNQLRVKLNGGNLKPLISHLELAKGQDYLLPSWKGYVERSGPKNIWQYIEEATKIIEQIPASKM